MDKVIDGVNVSECDRLRTYRDWTYSSDKWCGISNDGGCECDQNPNCYYKQLQRLKEELRTERIHSSQIEELEESLQHAKAENKELSEENSKLKGKLDAYKMSENEANEIIVELKAENERLKEELRNNSDVLIHEMGLKDEYQSDYVFEKLERQKYEQALQEIREMATLFHSVNENKGLDRFKNNILDKINSVIGAK